MMTANVIIRTNSRPVAFKRCLCSVLMQDYQNIKIHVISDGDDQYPYHYTNIKNYKVYVPEKRCVEMKKPIGREYGAYFPYNDYIAQIQTLCEGYIFLLDDDDMYIVYDAISSVMKRAKKDHLIVWRVYLLNKVIPSDDNFKKRIVAGDISGISFCYHHSQIHRTDWSPFKRADYRTAKGFDKIIWIDEVLSCGQSNKNGHGNRKDVLKLS